MVELSAPENSQYRYTTRPNTKKQLAGDRPLWHRQPGETEKAWLAFKSFLDSDDRVVGAHHSRRNWSAKWHWRERSTAYDQWMMMQQEERKLRYRWAMDDKQRREGALMQAKAVQRLAELNPGELTPSEAKQYMEIGAKIERLAAGAESERTATSTSITGNVEIDVIAKMSAEDVERALLGLQQEIAGRTGLQLPASYQEPATTEAEVIEDAVEGDLSASNPGPIPTPQVEQNLSNRPDSGVDTAVSEEPTPDPEPEVVRNDVPGHKSAPEPESVAPSNVASIHRGHNPHPGANPWRESTATPLYDDVL